MTSMSQGSAISQEAVARHAVVLRAALRALCDELGVEPGRRHPGELRDGSAALRPLRERLAELAGRCLELVVDLETAVAGEATEAAANEIGEIYDRLAEISDSRSAGRRDEESALWERLRTLQEREADAWEMSFRAGLAGPVDGGARLLDKLRALRAGGAHSARDHATAS